MTVLSYKYIPLTKKKKTPLPRFPYKETGALPTFGKEFALFVIRIQKWLPAAGHEHHTRPHPAYLWQIKPARSISQGGSAYVKVHQFGEVTALCEFAVTRVLNAPAGRGERSATK